MVRDPQTGKYRRARLFVLTLGYSRKSVRLLVFRSSSQTWAELHEKAFRRFGGVTRVVVLDNLREGVLTPSLVELHEPGFPRHGNKRFKPGLPLLDTKCIVLLRDLEAGVSDGKIYGAGSIATENSLFCERMLVARSGSENLAAVNLSLRCSGRHSQNFTRLEGPPTFGKPLACSCRIALSRRSASCNPTASRISTK